MDNSRIFVNTPMEPELVEQLDEMVKENESTRAQFIRLLVRKHYLKFTRETNTPKPLPKNKQGDRK